MRPAGRMPAVAFEGSGAEVIIGDTVYRDAVLHIRRTGDRQRLAFHGDINEVSQPGAAHAVWAAASECQVLHLDLSGLQSCDLAGLRAIIQPATAADAPRSRVQIVLHGVPHALRTALSVVGWDEYVDVHIES